MCAALAFAFLPSHGRGHRFKPCTAHHKINRLGYIPQTSMLKNGSLYGNIARYIWILPGMDDDIRSGLSTGLFLLGGLALFAALCRLLYGLCGRPVG
jgi:hypothetical protein